MIPRWEGRRIRKAFPRTSGGRPFAKLRLFHCVFRALLLLGVRTGVHRKLGKYRAEYYGKVHHQEDPVDMPSSQFHDCKHNM